MFVISGISIEELKNLLSKRKDIIYYTFEDEYYGSNYNAIFLNKTTNFFENYIIKEDLKTSISFEGYYNINFNRISDSTIIKKIRLLKIQKLNNQLYIEIPNISKICEIFFDDLIRDDMRWSEAFDIWGTPS